MVEYLYQAIRRGKRHLRSLIICGRPVRAEPRALRAELSEMVIEVAPLQRLPFVRRERTKERVRLLREARWPASAESLDQRAEGGFLGVELAPVRHLELGGRRQARLPWLRREQLLLRHLAKEPPDQAALERQLT